MLKTLLSATALLLAATTAQAATVDQSNLRTGSGGNALTIDSTTTFRAQTFTVGLDGILTGVRTSLSDPSAASGLQLDVGIFGVSGSTIDIASGPLLSKTVAPNLGSTGIFDYTLFETLFASSLPVSVGETYAIVLSGVSGPQNQGFFWDGTGDTYASGSRWQVFSPAGSLVEVSTQDHAFETLVSTSVMTPIPLPASLPLLLAGLGAFGLLRRRRG